jgi:hypothetical protein
MIAASRLFANVYSPLLWWPPWVIFDGFGDGCGLVDVRFAPESAEVGAGPAALRLPRRL